MAMVMAWKRDWGFKGFGGRKGWESGELMGFVK
jgi:hypothetical protein